MMLPSARRMPPQGDDVARALVEVDRGPDEQVAVALALLGRVAVELGPYEVLGAGLGVDDHDGAVGGLRGGRVVDRRRAGRPERLDRVEAGDLRDELGAGLKPSLNA
jgi:hypothetical protein